MQQSPVPGGGGGMDNIPRSGSGGIVPAAPAVARTGSNSTASVGASTPQRRPMPPTTRETPKRSTGSGGLPPVIPSLSATSTGSGGSDFSGCPVPKKYARVFNCRPTLPFLFLRTTPPPLCPPTITVLQNSLSHQIFFTLA